MSSKQLTIIKPDPVPQLYQKMQMAIIECYSLDDCKRIAAEATAIAAYYKQIKDDESVRKFLQIKLRAWRRIGEIISSFKINKLDCKYQGVFNQAEYIRRIKTKLKNNKEAQELSDNDFRQALKIMEVPVTFLNRMQSIIIVWKLSWVHLFSFDVVNGKQLLKVKLN